MTSGDADLLAEAVGEQRAALQHGLAVERVAEDAEELGGDPRVEHHGHPLGAGAARPEQAGGPLGGVGGGTCDVEIGEVPTDREAEPGLGVAVGSAMA